MKQINLKSLFYFFTAYLLLSIIYFNFSSFTNSFDNKIREQFFNIRGEIPTTGNIVIVDIDEKSLKQLGQWPFSRDKMAQVLVNLTNAQVGIIGLDIVFAEEDRISPHKMAEILNIKGDFLNNDVLLGNVVANTPTVLGYFFTINEINKNKVPTLPLNILNEQTKNTLIQAKGVVPNIKPIQDNSYSSGFFNAFSNNTGKLTHMPLVIQYNDSIFPSLSFEMIRIARQAQRVKLEYDNENLLGISLDDFFIPTNNKGFFNINFRGPQKSFNYISFADIFNNTFNKEDVKGKFVLVGTSVTTLADLRATVYDLSMPGVELHANILDNILKQDFLYKPTWALALDALIIFGLTLILGAILLFIKPLLIFPFITLLSLGLYTYFYDLLFTHGIILNLFFPIVCIIITTLMASLLRYLEERKFSLFIKDKFSKKVSSAVVEDLLAQKDHTFAVKNKEISIFFSDIRDFTKISEKINNPEKLINLLNLYMEPMTDEIIQNNGTIDKFIGDAIMAYWNAPQDCENHADLAVTSALNQLDKLEKLNHTLKEYYDLELNIGIGINTGLCTVGEMGSIGRSDYTIIGDNVNLASRVEGLTKFFGVKLIITDQTKILLKNSYHIRELATVKVKGKESSTILYEIKGFDTKQSEEDTLYEKALGYYKNSDLKKALKLFVQLNTLTPSKLYQLYVDSCEKYLNNDFENFTPIFVLDFK